MRACMQAVGLQCSCILPSVKEAPRAKMSMPVIARVFIIAAIVAESVGMAR